MALPPTKISVVGEAKTEMAESTLHCTVKDHDPQVAVQNYEQPTNPHYASRIKTSHTACRTCNASRMRCSQERPVCQTCRRRGKTCLWADNTPVRRAEDGRMDNPSVLSAANSSSVLIVTDSTVLHDADIHGTDPVDQILAINNKKRKAEPLEEDSTKTRVVFETIESNPPIDIFDGEIPKKAAGTFTPLTTASPPLHYTNAKSTHTKTSCLTCNSYCKDCTGSRPECDTCKKEGTICSWGKEESQNGKIRLSDQLSPSNHSYSSLPSAVIKQGKGDQDKKAAEQARLVTPTPAPTADSEAVPTSSETDAPTLKNTIPSTTRPAPCSPSTRLVGEQILLARIPGSTPLSERTIKKASEWFEKLLIDGNGVDLIEIGALLGVRIYREEDLEEYNRLRREVTAKDAAAQEARRKALLLVEALNAGGGDAGSARGLERGVGEEGTRRDSRRVQRPAPSLEEHGIRNSEESGEVREALSNVVQHDVGNPVPTYTLRLNVSIKRRFHGNAHYLADGRPRTQRSAEILAQKDALGSRDVVRVYDS